MQEHTLVEGVAPDQEVTKGVEEYSAGTDAHHREWMMHGVQVANVDQGLGSLDDQGEAEGGE